MNHETQPPSAKRFRICIQGHLQDSSLLDFSDMTLTLTPDGDTLLEGFLEDQSQMYGLVKLLRDSGMNVKSFHFPSPETEGDGPENENPR